MALLTKKMMASIPNRGERELGKRVIRMLRFMPSFASINKGFPSFIPMPTSFSTISSQIFFY